jgi:lipopolysaccharide/colanic/teichoic acid biosynthesis glycosyltransferase
MHSTLSIYGKFGKRFIDLLLAFLMLIIFLPVFSVLSILVYFAFGRPIFFRQVRPGLNGKPFTMYKFRTMTNKRYADGSLLCRTISG